MLVRAVFLASTSGSFSLKRKTSEALVVWYFNIVLVCLRCFWAYWGRVRRDTASKKVWLASILIWGFQDNEEG